MSNVVFFREGVVLKRPLKKGRGSFVDCGIDKVSYCYFKILCRVLKLGTFQKLRNDGSCSAEL